MAIRKAAYFNLDSAEADEQEALPAVDVDASDFDKSWEYIRILIH
jgi:hypothetical protein